MAQMLPVLVALFLRTCLAELRSDEGTKQTEVPSRRLAPWLQGLVAVIGFLFLVFVIFIINKVWCAGKEEDVYADVPVNLAVDAVVDETGQRHADHNSSRNDVRQHKAFENPTLENEEEGENISSVETASTAF